MSNLSGIIGVWIFRYDIKSLFQGPTFNIKIKSNNVSEEINSTIIIVVIWAMDNNINKAHS